MKTLLMSICLLITGATALTAQVGSLDTYFKKYQNDDSFTIVNISSSMFSAIAGMEMDELDPAIKAAFDNITGMKILTKKSNGEPYYTEVMNLINSKGLEELMTIKQKSGNVKIYGKSDGKEKLREVVMLRGDKSNFILTQILGSLTIEQLSGLSKTLNK